MIKVYFDEGVVKTPYKSLLFELSKWNVSSISAKEIINSNWENETKLLIIPGGRDVPFHEALMGKGNAKIRSFVENGGSFLGICAGGYYGCKSVEFDIGMPLEVVGKRELAFFPGTGRGPAYGPGTYQYDSESGAQATNLSDSFYENSFKTYFNGGCYFAEAEKYQQIKTLSRYLDIPGTPSAIIECPIGKGKAILSGVHFEIGTTDPRTPLRGKMKECLKEYEPQRRQFFSHIIQHLTTTYTQTTSRLGF